MNKRTKTNLKIAGATSVCIFSLVSLFTTTIAWFSSNTTANVSGMSITVDLGETDVSAMTVHRCDLSNSTDTVLKFYETPSVTVSGHGSVEAHSGIEMSDYSTLSQTQPVLLLFYFNNGLLESDIEITATSSTGSFVSSATAENIGAFPFSSAVTFKCASYSSNSFPFNNVQTSNLSSPSSFVSFTKTDGRITGSSFTSSLTIFDGVNNTSITYLAIVLDYYAEAIDYIIANTSFEIFNDHNNCIDFVCDWALSL